MHPATVRFPDEVWKVIVRVSSLQGVDAEEFIREAAVKRAAAVAVPTAAVVDPMPAISDPDRLQAMRDTGRRRDEPPDETLDELTRRAAEGAGSPIALVTMVDTEGQFFVGAHGLPDTLATTRQTPLSHSFCQHVVARGQPVIVPDARQDGILAVNSAVEDLGAVAYLGVPVATDDGCLLGSFCVFDYEPRDWTEENLELLTKLAASASAEIQGSAASTL